MAMGRGRDLATMAGLAGLAYAMRNKDEAPIGKEDTGPGYKSIETREKSAGDKAVDNTDSSILTALQKPKNIREEGIAAANDVRTIPFEKNPTPVRKIQSATNNIAASKTPSADSTTSLSEEGMSRGTRPKDPRGMEASMSRGTRRNFGKEESIKTDALRNASREDFKQGLKSYADYAEDIAASKKKPAKKMASGGITASKRADGIASKGKTRGKIC